jgi:hypothetical protein
MENNACISSVGIMYAITVMARQGRSTTCRARSALLTPAMLPRLVARRAASLSLLLILCACGGGGDDAPQAPSPTTSVSSSGDASHYVGPWHGGCTLVVLNSPTEFHAVQYSFTLTSSTASQASGTLTLFDFGTTNPSCSSTPTVTHKSVTITVDATVAASGIVAGTADRVTIKAAGAADQIAYIAFTSDFKRFWLDSSASYSTTSGQYAKY